MLRKRCGSGPVEVGDSELDDIGVTIRGTDEESVHILFDDLIGFTDAKDAVVITYCPKEARGRRVVERTYSKTPAMENLVTTLERRLPEQRHFLVLVNPASGKGHAPSIWEKTAKPLFDIAKCTYEVMVTARPAEAMTITQTHPLTNVNAVVIVSGDGLIYEALQGLRSRGQVLPLAQVPAGGGNALCASLLYEAEEAPACLTSAILMILRGNVKPLDLVKVDVPSENQSDTTTDAFLSLTCGILADLDADSESVRWMGTARFTAAGIWRALALRIYDGEMYYLPPDKTGVSLPPLAEELPSEFVKVDMKDFVSANVVNLAMLTNDYITCPAARAADGLLYIIVIHNIGRIAAFKVLLGFEDASYLNHPGVHVIPCTAFRLVPQPRRSGNCLMVDGERLPFGPVQGAVLPSAAQVIGFPSKRALA